MTFTDDSRRDAISHVGITIAIDGPAGSGKSTISKALASRLGIGYLDTGAMYRALTWYALDREIDLDDQERVRALADEMPLIMDSDPVSPVFHVGATDVTAAIREPRIALAIPKVSTNLPVRKWMASEQRRRMMEARANGSGMIAEGRDITTVVCPMLTCEFFFLLTRKNASVDAHWNFTGRSLTNFWSLSATKWANETLPIPRFLSS